MTDTTRARGRRATAARRPGPARRLPPALRLLGLVAAVLLLGVQCSLGTTEPDGGLRGNGRRVLFLGNSLTYVNDVPGMVQSLAAQSGGEPLAVAMVALPDASLEDLWNDGQASRVIAGGRWSVVVLQQGPSALEESRDLLRQYTGLFATQIRAAGARPALYGVWPWRWRLEDYERSTQSYQIAASDVGGLMFPVAQAWRLAWARDPSLTFYAGDGVHATPLGSYVAALVIYAMLADRSPVGLPASVRPIGGGTLTVDPAIALLLQEAAAEAIATYGRR